MMLYSMFVSSVRKVEDADLLPNIEYNIIAGNTLLGFDQSVETKVLDEFSPLDINEFVEDLAGYPDHKARIKELSEKPTIKNVFLIKDLLVRLYKSEHDPNSAQNVKKTVEKVHVPLQKIM